MAQGKLFVFAGASGSGKTTICKRLAEEGLGLISISHTTRPISNQETDGVEYHFVSRQRFEQMIETGEMAEWAKVHGDLYGTGVQWLHDKQAAGSNIFLDIDVQGMLQLRSKIQTIHTTFILPESWDVLQKRLSSRKRDNAEQIKRRLKTAVQEFRQIKEFEYLIVNDELDHAYALARAIVKACCGDQESNAQATTCLAANQPGLIDKWQVFSPDGI